MLRLILALVAVFATTAAALLPFEAAGPFATTRATFKYSAPASTGCSGRICDISATVTYPASTNGSYPVALFLHGFQLTAADYASTCERLATYGYVVVAWDTNEGLLTGTEHGVLAKMAATLFDFALEEESLPVDFVWAKNYLVAGHSMGAKIAALVAQSDSRAKSVFLADPVDCDPPMTNPNNGDWPHVLDNPSALSVPTAVVGSEFGTSLFLGQACAPAECGFELFYQEVALVTWSLEVKEAGHMQFTDKANPLVDIACKNGNASRSAVLQITQTMLVVWAENTIRDDRSLSTYQGAWAEALGDAVDSRVK